MRPTMKKTRRKMMQRCEWRRQTVNPIRIETTWEQLNKINSRKHEKSQPRKFSSKIVNPERLNKGNLNWNEEDKDFDMSKYHDPLWDFDTRGPVAKAKTKDGDRIQHLKNTLHLFVKSIYFPTLSGRGFSVGESGTNSLVMIRAIVVVTIPANWKCPHWKEYCVVLW